MPYRRRYKRRRQNVRSLVKREIDAQAEKKFKIVSWSGKDIPSSAGTPVDQVVSTTDQGTGQQYRIGNMTMLTGLYADLWFTIQDVGAGTGGVPQFTAIRMLLYIPKEASSPLASMAFNGAPDTDKYTVLMDKLITLDQYNLIKRRQLKFSWTRNGRRGIHQQFSGSAGTTVTKNPVYLYLVSDYAGANTLPPHVDGYIKCYFKDS